MLKLNGEIAMEKKMKCKDWYFYYGFVKGMIALDLAILFWSVIQ